MATYAKPRGEPVVPKEDCSPFDIGLVISTISKASNSEKYRFINNVWKPTLDYDFPASVETRGKLRKCRHEWLVRYTWLVYSKYLDGLFCLPCALFGIESGKNAARLDKLFRSPLTFWTTAVTRFQNHSSGKCETHNFAVVAMANFKDMMSRRTVAIDQQLNQIVQRQIQENRQKIKSIIKTVVLCGQNAIPLRGERDDNPDDETLTGKFQALLAFRVDSGDAILQQHLENAPRNATYRSKTIQNEIIKTIGSFILSKISDEIKESKLFSVVADEAADISNKEQLSLVPRFVDASQQIREEFIGFYHCEAGTSGEALKEMILGAVADLGLSMSNCRGQSYDGAGNMAGKYNGVSSLIQGQFSKALYVHCMNHRLNLCVADTCSLYLVKNMMSVVRSLSSFFSGSPKRQQHLKEKVKSLLPASKHEVLINICETRWIARLDGLDRIVELLLPVVCTIDDIANNRKVGHEDPDSGDWNQNSKTAAGKILPSITFEFITTLIIVRYILDLTRPATVKLQRKEMDLLKAHSEITSLKNVLKDLRSNIDVEHRQLYQEAVELAAKVGIQPHKPRVIPVQVYRNNNPSQSIEGHYRVNLSIIFIDHALKQLDTRFPAETNLFYQGFSISSLRLLKNYLRSTTGQDRLNGLALMHAHRKAIPLDYEKIIDLFATLHPRRMRMAHIICSDD